MRSCHHHVGIISSYSPHSRYNIDYLEQIYDIRFCSWTLSRRGFKIIIGGDFNTTIAQNTRADLLFELVHAFDLIIGDDPILKPFHESWSYNHAVYGKRQIDFMLLMQYHRR